MLVGVMAVSDMTVDRCRSLVRVVVTGDLDPVAGKRIISEARTMAAQQSCDVLYDLVMRNVGLSVRMFFSEDEALRWLRPPVTCEAD
jgi:hypothetical protein